MSKSEPRPMEIEDLFSITLVSDPAISPDEQRIVWVETRLHKDDDCYKSAIWIAQPNGSGARKLTSGTHRDTGPVWSPDGETIVFLSNRPGASRKDDDTVPNGPVNQLWTIRPDGGEAVQVTAHPNGASSPAWSPDGRRIAFSASDDTDADAGYEAAITVGVHADETVVNDIRYRFDGRGPLKRYSHIWAVDLHSRDTVQLTSGDVQDAHPAWSPDGRTVAFVGNRREDRRRRSSQTVLLVSANGGEARTIAPDDAMFCEVSWSPDGKRLAFTGHEDAASGRTRNIGVWTVHADGSNLTNHTAKVDVTFTDAGMSDITAGSAGAPCWIDADTLLVQGAAKGATRLYRVSLAGGKPDAITSGSERVVQADIRPAGKTIVMVAGATDRPFELRTSTAKGKREKTIRDPNSHITSEVHIASPEEMKVTAPDGTKVQTWLLPPRGLDPSSEVTYPLIVQIHGGPHAMYGHAMFHEMQVMASRGYGVLFCNPRGSAGYGEKFTGITRGVWGESDMPDVIAAVDVATQIPWVDTNRLGITGGSYGGYLTNWIIGHDTRFRAAVTQRCVSNLHSFIGTSDIGFDFGIYEFGGTPWGDADTLLRHSPLTYADRIETPLLILHSEQDLRCPIEQAEQLFTALKYLEKPVTFVRIPSESHDLSRSGTPSRRVARLRHLIGWFDDHL